MESSNKAIYTAVPLLSVDEQNQGETLNKTRQVNCVDDEDRSAKSYKITPFLAGALLGAAFSVIGFRILVKQQSDDSYQSIFWFALLWSTVTSTVSYCFFGAFWCALRKSYQESTFYRTLSNHNFLADIEYYFAVGVFIGFCFACTISDILYGLPWIGICLTVAVACVWTGIMTWFASGNKEEERHATILPTVIV